MYVTLQDMRVEGISDPPYSDGYVEGRITIAQALVDQLTGQFFEPRTHTVRLKGRGHGTLWLPVPPVTADTALTVTINTETLDPTYYEIDLDSRHNPKLERLSGVWTDGVRVTITGLFGFVDVAVVDDEPVYTTPVLIKDLTKRMVKHKLPKVADDEALRSQNIIRERLRDYEYELSGAANSDGFADSEIPRLISMYRQAGIFTV